MDEDDESNVGVGFVFQMKEMMIYFKIENLVLVVHLLNVMVLELMLVIALVLVLVLKDGMVLELQVVVLVLVLVLFLVINIIKDMMGC